MNLLPIAMKIQAKTIASDLVSVTPMNGLEVGELERIRIETEQINRQAKIDSVLNDEPYKEMKITEHKDWKESNYGNNLFYIDYTYSK